MLLYADDLFIMGDHVGRVQSLLNALSVFCEKWGLSINMNKTKAMVYRNGGIIRKNEKFFLNANQIECVSYYKYLGVLMSTRLSWSPAQKYLALQANRACFTLNDILYTCDYSFKIGVKLFDTCILPILIYGSELYAAKIHDCIESVHMKYFKKLIGVGENTMNSAVRGECGQHRIYVACVMKCIKYWFKLIGEKDGTLLKRCYTMLYRSCENGKSNWASEIKQLLSLYGYYEVWLNQGTPDIKLFLSNFELRVKDCEKQNWAASIVTSPKLHFYSMFKKYFETEMYLYENWPRRVKTQYSRFRLSNHNLKKEVGGQENLSRDDRLCVYCGSKSNLIVIECEFHFLLECTMYENLRKQFSISFEKTLFNFVEIMSDDNSEYRKDLPWFIYMCFLFIKQSTDI